MPDELANSRGQAFDARAHGSPPSAGSQPLYEARTLADIEAQAIREAMQVHDGNITAVARSLDISRATLYRKLRGT